MNARKSKTPPSLTTVGSLQVSVYERRDRSYQSQDKKQRVREKLVKTTDTHGFGKKEPT